MNSAPAYDAPAVGRQQPTLAERVANAILSAAADVLVERERASMSDVAVAAGVARGTVYRYFRSRDVLIERLCDAAIDDASSRLTMSRINEVDPIEGLERAIRVFVEVGNAFAIAVRERAQVGTRLETAVVEPLRSLIGRGQAAGVLREDLSDAWLAESLLGLVLAALRFGALGTEDTIAAVKRLFLDGAQRGDG